MNHYAPLGDVKSALNIYDTASDVRLFRLIEHVSRDIDDTCGRHFATKPEARIFPVIGGRGYFFIDDLLSLASLAADSEGDGTFDGETWTLGTDFVLQPENGWPKTKVLLLAGGQYRLPHEAKDRYIKITGIWGHGDGESASPWEASGATVSAATAISTTATVSAANIIQQGQTLLVGSEQMFVTAVNNGQSPSITVTRGVNGTTAAIQSSALASVALYPGRVCEGALALCKVRWNENPGITQERYADSSGYVRTQDYEAVMDRIFGRYVKRVV